MIIAVINQKGGVGKTTTTVNLGAAIAEAGRPVLLIDLDTTQQSLMRQTTNLDAHFAGCEIIACTPKSLPAELKRRHIATAQNSTDAQKLVGQGAKQIQRAASELQPVVLLDCPPNLGHETAAALTFAHLAFVPLQPELPALEGLAALQVTLEAARGINPTLAIRLLVTMADTRDPNCAAIEAQVRDLFGADVLAATVKRSPVFSRAVLEGTSVLHTSSRSHGALAYRRAASEILAEEMTFHAHR